MALLTFHYAAVHFFMYLYIFVSLSNGSLTYYMPRIFMCIIIIMAPYVMGDIIFLSCGFYLLLLSFFSSPNLSHRRLDVCHTLTHGVAIVRIWNADLKHAARGTL